jgi:hypothetical protein
MVKITINSFFYATLGHVQLHIYTQHNITGLYYNKSSNQVKVYEKKLIKIIRTIEQYKEHILTSSLSCGFRDNC